MTPMRKGLVIALAQLALMTGVAGVLLYERETLPRAWALTAGVDPYLPIRGRYVELRLLVDTAVPPGDLSRDEGMTHGYGRVTASDGRLHVAAIESESEAGWPGPEQQLLQVLDTDRGRAWVLAGPVAFFLAEDAPDPTRLEPGEELWAEVTVPPKGPPRPIRLEVRSGGR